MESISDHFRGLRVVSARYTRAYLPLIIFSHFQFDVQSHIFSFGVQSHYHSSVLAFRVILLNLTFGDISSQFWRLEPLSLFSSAFGAIISSQFQAFRATISFHFGVRSHYLLLVSGIQGHHLSTVQHSESHLQFGIRSRRSHIQAFKAIISPQFDIQSHHLFSVWVFRATIPSQLEFQSHHPIMIRRLSPPFRRSELYSGVQSHRSHSSVQSHRPHSGVQSHRLHSGIQSHITSIQDFHFLLNQHSKSFLPFRATFISFRRSEPCIHFDIQSHCPAWHSVLPSSLSFGVQNCCAYSFRHLESPSFLILVFRVAFPQSCHSKSQLMTFIFTGIAHLTFAILHSSSVFLTSPLCAYHLFIMLFQTFHSTTHDMVH